MRPHLQIHQPCNENWEAMTPTEKGRFCQACQHEVQDFSQMTDQQIAQYFKNAAGKVCGNFRREQLNRSYSPNPKTRRPLPWLKPSLVFASLLALAKLPAKSQTPLIPKLVMHDTLKPIPVEDIEPRVIASDKKPSVLKGKVVLMGSGKEYPINGVRVKVEGTNIECETNEHGEYVLELTPGFGDGVTLSFTSLTYGDKEVYVPLTEGEDVVVKTQTLMTVMIRGMVTY